MAGSRNELETLTDSSGSKSPVDDVRTHTRVGIEVRA